MTLLLLVALGWIGWRWAYRRWTSVRFSTSWWRAQTRRELQETPEAAHWQWNELKDRER